MTDSQSDAAIAVDDYAATVASVVGGSVEPAVDTVKVSVPASGWVSALTAARDDLGLVFFSWLAGVDWTNDVAVGDPPAEEVDQRIEILCTVADVTDGRRVTFSTSLDWENPVIDSLVAVYPGANWHERETAEMLGVEFLGHPDPGHLYLPDSFLGNPLRKSYKLLSREVKPWPGTVDVEAMPGVDDDDAPATENPEA
ncbi:MAG: NADH-quinone oxidoreductase subunit C [Acidimicrobiia bacterium]|nr:NADH-quinone oxidoreductase subunit C [Acidimicrobiia bacterium]MDH4309302.1 NADH-quinone oxidoreductase subunit C [Acidimicrobiia bacterium]